MSTAVQDYETDQYAGKNDYAKLHQRLLSAFKEIGAVDKTGHNEDQHYTYQKASDVAATVRVVLAKNGLFPEVKAENRSQFQVETKNGKIMHGERVDMYVRFVDAETGCRSQWYPGFASSLATDDKAIFKAMTTGMKYALRNAFLIPDGKDDVENDEKLQAALMEEAKVQGIFGVLTAQRIAPDESWFKFHDPMTNADFHLRVPAGVKYQEMLGAFGAPVGVKAIPEGKQQNGERIFRLVSVTNVGDVPGKEEDPTFLPPTPKETAQAAMAVREQAEKELAEQVYNRGKAEPTPETYTPSQQLMEDAKRAQDKIRKLAETHNMTTASQIGSPRVTVPQAKRAWVVARQMDESKTNKEVNEYLQDAVGRFGYEDISEIPKADYNKFIRSLDPDNRSGMVDDEDKPKWKTRRTR